MNAGTAHGAKFEEAVHVSPLGQNRYSAFLQSAFCIGTGMSSNIYQPSQNPYFSPGFTPYINTNNNNNK